MAVILIRCICLELLRYVGGHIVCSKVLMYLVRVFNIFPGFPRVVCLVVTQPFHQKKIESILFSYPP